MILTEQTRVTYDISDSVPEVFNVPFKFFQRSDIRCSITLLDGTFADLVLNTDFSVSAPADTGKVTRLREWQEANILTIYREVPLLQETDLRNGDKYDAEIVERMVDKVVAGVQQVYQRVRNMIAARPDDLARNLTLPNAGDRANCYLAFDNNGNVIVSPGSPTVPASRAGADLISKETTEEMREYLSVLGDSELVALITEASKQLQEQIDYNIDKPPLFMVTPAFNDDDLIAGYLGVCLICDGSTYNWADYPEADIPRFKSFLDKYAANYGADKATNGGLGFRMPDFSGLSIVGAGANSVIRIRNVAGTDTADAYTSPGVGSLQRDATRNITGAFGSSGLNGIGFWNVGVSGAFGVSGSTVSHFTSSSSSTGSAVNIITSRVVPTANANIVASIPVLWVIRVA